MAVYQVEVRNGQVVHGNLNRAKMNARELSLYYEDSVIVRDLDSGEVVYEFLNWNTLKK